MNLYDYTRINQKDFDVVDVDYDTSITVCYINEVYEVDDYDRFCNNIIKKVEVIAQINDYTLVANWTKLIKDNMNQFKSFTKEYWNYQYEDDEDEFIYQWIKEIHSYMSGYVYEDFYKTLRKFVDDLV